MDVATGEPESKGTRWVCPSDRQLALRAKLRTGWSVKTGSLDSRLGSYSNPYTSGTNSCRQSFALSDEERDAIIQVIQRAEALDLSEQERVGKLVERLENMKRNVCMVTSSRSNERRRCGSRCLRGTRCVCSCALCGEKFGAVLGATPSLCKDCRNYICQKCGIEAACPSAIINDGISSPRQGASPTSRSFRERSTVQRIIQRSASNAQKQFLCRICAETREMWKKSGAWFFKSMPKYVLPVKKERGWSRVTPRSSTWTIDVNASRSLESADPQDSSSDEDATRRLVVARTFSVSSSSVLQSTRENENNKTAENSVPMAGNSPRSPRDRSIGFSPTDSRTEYLSPGSEKNGPAGRAEQGSVSLSTSPINRVSPSNSISTIKSRCSVKSDRQSSQRNQPDNRSTTEGEVEVEVDAIEDADDENDEFGKKTSPGERLKSPQLQTFRSSTMMPATSLTSVSSTSTTGVGHQRSPEQASTEQNYGTLEVSLRYEPATQCLQCKVERARGLRPMDIHGLADPFCKLNILPIGKGTTSRRLRTKTVHKTRDPEFNETVNFYGTMESDLTSGRALHVLILQDDPAGQDFLGEARFPLSKLQPCRTKRYNVTLQDHYPVNEEEEVWGGDSSGRGQIQLTLSYCTRRRALLVTVHRATNLLPMDSNGFSDPFVKLSLVEDPKDNHRQQREHNSQKSRISLRSPTGKKNITDRTGHSTSVKWKTLNPEWNEEFVFPTRLTDLTKLALCLSVWDKDFGKSNDYLGSLTLGCNSKGARLRHWVDVIKFPDRRHQAWHNLIDMNASLES